MFAENVISHKNIHSEKLYTNPDEGGVRSLELIVLLRRLLNLLVGIIKSRYKRVEPSRLTTIDPKGDFGRIETKPSLTINMK